jgi:RNA polymerase sigma-70 factor (ECF subfamily)
MADEIDLATLELCRAGERAALERFVRCYQTRVFAFLSRALGYGLSIEDLAQDVFIRAYRALADFDPSGQARLSTWVLTIAYRVLVDARRRQNSSQRFAMAPAEHDTQTPEQQLSNREIGAALARAVSELSPEQRDVFVLAEFHELSMLEIANVTGIRQATVKTRLFRARNQLRLRLAALWETNR